MTANTSITIRRLDPRLKQKLRERAAKHGRSMEEEARKILEEAVEQRGSSKAGWAVAIRRRFASAGYVELELPRRDPIREPPFSRDP